MEKIEIAKYFLESSEKWPYDAPDEWWGGNGENPPPATDWAHAAARGVVADLCDRRGIKDGFNAIEEETRAKIVQDLAEIIRQAKGA